MKRVAGRMTPAQSVKSLTLSDLKLQEYLDTWCDWSPGFVSRPKILRPLLGGLTNQTFLVGNDDGQRAVLRVNSPISAALGIDRSREKYLLGVAEAAGLAPETYYNNLDILVSEYLDTAPADDLLLAEKRSDLRRCMERVHTLSVDLPALDYQAYFEAYLKILSDAQHPQVKTFQAQYPRYRETLEALDSSADERGARVLCHHDATLANLLYRQQKPLLIDWEYAARGIVEMDWVFSDVPQPFDAEILVLRGYMNRLWEAVKIVRG
ncbi:MAG: phosphotransferase [bacterium]